MTEVKASHPTVCYASLSIGRLAAGPNLMSTPIGHNIQSIFIQVELRLFNSVTRYANGKGTRHQLSLPAGTTVGELAARMGIPRDELFLVLVNGRDITPGLVGDQIKDYHMIEDGDVVAFSGAVPYSYGYGSPVV